ncbi:MAG: SEC-C domain-containing protein [Betaproteobacteria bacterium]|nr:SEC-C domain-containing protein [Betaproteobacteria bacterium]
MRPQTPSPFPAFEPTRVKTSKRQKGFPSETGVKRSLGRWRVVHGDKELLEKLGRNDPCPCHSGRRFQELLHEVRRVRRQ